MICLLIGGSLVMANTSVGGKIAALFSIKAQSVETANRTSPNDDGRISPEALRQIESLIKEKESRSPAPQKIDSNLYEIKMRAGQRIADDVATLEMGLNVDENNYIEVDITANVSKRLLKHLSEINAKLVMVLPQYRSVTGKIPLTEIESLAAMDEVIFIQPKLQATTNQSAKPLTTTQLFGNPVQPLISPTFENRAGHNQLHDHFDGN